MATKRPIYNLYVLYTIEDCKEFDPVKGTMRNVAIKAVQELTTIHRKDESQRAAYNRLMASAGFWINKDKEANKNHTGHTIVDWQDKSIEV